MADAQRTKEPQGTKSAGAPRGGFRGGRSGEARPARGQGGRRGGPRGRGARRERPEFDQKTIDIRRVTRVVSGGRRFSFSVALVAGDRKGAVGVGIGKAADTALAIEKAFRNAKKHMVKVKHTKEMSIPHEVAVKEGSARLSIYPTPGRGIVAGSSVRTVFDLAGLKDVGAKITSRSKNKLNIARATIKALQSLE